MVLASYKRPTIFHYPLTPNAFILEVIIGKQHIMDVHSNISLGSGSTNQDGTATSHQMLLSTT